MSGDVPGQMARLPSPSVRAYLHLTDVGYDLHPTSQFIMGMTSWTKICSLSAGLRRLSLRRDQWSAPENGVLRPCLRRVLSLVTRWRNTAGAMRGFACASCDVPAYRVYTLSVRHSGVLLRPEQCISTMGDGDQNDATEYTVETEKRRGGADSPYPPIVAVRTY